MRSHALPIGLALAGLALAVAPLAGCQEQRADAPSSSEAGEAPAVGPDADTVAGTIGGEEITVGEVDAWIKDQLFKQTTRGGNPVKVHEIRNRALEQMANEQALEQAATKTGKDSNELLREEVERRASVSDEEVQAYYDENKARFRNLPFDKVAPAVKRQLLAQRQVEAMQGYTKGLRDELGFENRLEPPRFELATAGAPTRGPDDAPVTLVEFSDYECPFCKSAEPVLDEVLERYPQQVKLVFKHYPLATHPKARPAAEAAMCAAEQGKFWEFHEKLFEKAPQIDAAQLGAIASQIEGLDRQAFDQCVASGATKQAVQADFDAGSQAGVAGTPSFFVNGVPLTGGRTADDFARVIDAELERLGLPVPPPPAKPVVRAPPSQPAPAPAAAPAAARPSASTEVPAEGPPADEAGQGSR